MSFAAALSEHPVLAQATGEVIGQILERLPGPPDLACLFVTAAHGGALEDAAGAVQATLGPRALIGAAASGVTGPRRNVEGGAGVSLWAGGPFRAEAVVMPPGAGTLPRPSFEPAAAIVLADPFSVDATALLGGLTGLPGLGASGPGVPVGGVPVVGGMASAATGAGGNRLAAGSRVVSGGAVIAFVDSGAGVRGVVSQGARPVGRPFTITRAEGRVIHELAGQPAMDRLTELARDELAPSEVAIVNSGGLFLGCVTDEHRSEFGPGDFDVYPVLGMDRAIGAIAVGAELEVGSTVQYHLRDAAGAGADLRALVSGRAAGGALAFTATERGTRLFGRRDHDANTLADALDDAPVAGMATAGEIGPVGGANRLVGMAASVALFDPVSRG